MKIFEFRIAPQSVPLALLETPYRQLDFKDRILNGIIYVLVWADSATALLTKKKEIVCTMDIFFDLFLDWIDVQYDMRGKPLNWDAFKPIDLQMALKKQKKYRYSITETEVSAEDLTL